MTHAGNIPNAENIKVTNVALNCLLAIQQALSLSGGARKEALRPLFPQVEIIGSDSSSLKEVADGDNFVLVVDRLAVGLGKGGGPVTEQDLDPTVVGLFDMRPDRFKKALHLLPLDVQIDGVAIEMVERICVMLLAHKDLRAPACFLSSSHSLTTAPWAGKP